MPATQYRLNDSNALKYKKPGYRKGTERVSTCELVSWQKQNRKICFFAVDRRKIAVNVVRPTTVASLSHSASTFDYITMGVVRVRLRQLTLV